MGMTHALRISVDSTEGEYRPKPLPDASRFRKWLELAQPDPGVRALGSVKKTVNQVHRGVPTGRYATHRDRKRNVITVKRVA